MKNRFLIRFLASLLIMLVTVFCIAKPCEVKAASGTGNSKFTISISEGALIKGGSKTIQLNPETTEVKSYSSSDNTIVRVNSKGQITALKSGTATITVTSKTGYTATLKIKVMSANSDMVINKTINGKKALWRLKDGKVYKKTGFSTDGIKWYYCENGQVSTKTSIIHSNGKTYRVSKGRVLKSVKGNVDAFYSQSFSLKIGGKVKKIERPGISISLTRQYSATKWVDGLITIDGTDHYFGLEYNNGKYEVTYLEPIDEVNITFVKKNGSDFYLKLTKKGAPKKAFKVSGKASDHYVTKDFEYLESDNLIIFMPKGIHFDGNVLNRLEEYVSKVEKATGLKRKAHKSSYYNRQCVFKTFFGTDIFSDIDPDSKKIHVLIDDKGDYSPECSADYTGNDYNYIIIHEYDLDVNNKDYFFSTFIHEYTHYVHLTNYACVSNIINEGYAAYIEEKVANGYMKLDDNSLYQERFYGYLIKKGSITANNAEKLFINDYSNQRTISYRYGCYLTKYLIDTYGGKTYRAFLKKCTTELEKKQKKDSSVEVLSGEELSKLLKSEFSKTVFKDFAGWLAKHPEYTTTDSY